jgi:hypothetical protein
MQQTHRISPFRRVAGFLALSCLAASGVWAQTPIRIDCGGASSTFTGADGQQWLTDRYFTSSDTRYTGSPIANTADQYLYRTARAGLYSDFQYNIPVTNSSYNLTLKFAEIQYNARGQRVFNVTVNGVKVLNNFDIMAEVSKATALDKTFPVSVTNGNINIQFTGVVGRGIINAIKVEPSATTSTTTATATGPYYAEVGGLVSLEAEHGKIINRSGEQWIPSTNSWDYSGGGFLLPSPTSGTVFDPNYVGVAPEVQFQVNFQTIGTYAVWLRGAGTNVHVGLDGAAVAGASEIGNFTANWGWSHTRMDGSFATLTITSAGVHTVNVWMRDDAFWFDKLVLAQTSGYTPSGTGPAESASSMTAPTTTTTSTTTTPPPTTTASGPYYSEAGGVVSLEAEDGTIVNRSGKQWTASTNSWNYSGNGFLLPSPTTGTVFDPNYVGVAPEVQFQVNFQTTGTYAVWVRGAGTNVHAGLDGVAVATASDIGNFTADWGWSHTRMDGSFATLTVAAAGVHTVNVWMRDDAFWFDKIVLTQGAAPTGTGPNESTLVGGTSSTPAPAPAPNPVASSRPPFGVVHPPSNGCNSTVASAGFVQNWWDQGGSVSSLQSAVSAENNCGKMEVPLFFTSPNWNATQSQIASAMTSYFKGNPSIPYWQFGWEENIHGRCCSSTDLSTLYSELSGVAAGRSAAGVSTEDFRH